jgi:hypothetical protein
MVGVVNKANSYGFEFENSDTAMQAHKQLVASFGGDQSVQSQSAESGFGGLPVAEIIVNKHGDAIKGFTDSGDKIATITYPYGPNSYEGENIVTKGKVITVTFLPGVSAVDKNTVIDQIKNSVRSFGDFTMVGSSVADAGQQR